MGNDILERLESQAEALRAHGVKKIGIFGSYARDEADVKSDVDVYVELNEAQRTFRNFNAIYEILEQITILCSRPSFLRKQESSPNPRNLDAGSSPA